MIRYNLKARDETTPEASYVYFMKMIYMQFCIDISDKDFWLQERSMLAKDFILTPQYKRNLNL
jgi:hypothetical protein